MCEGEKDPKSQHRFLAIEALAKMYESWMSWHKCETLCIEL